MKQTGEQRTGDPFELIEPDKQRAPLVFNSPHSGARYDPAFLAASQLGRRAIRQSEDVFVDELFIAALHHGAPLLRAHFPRAWLDVNREAYELDPKMFRDPLPPFANPRSARVASGLGTVPRVVADGQPIYRGVFPIADALARIEGVYIPYHRLLADTIDRTRQDFGFAVLVDCHSMPSTVRSAHYRSRPDFVLGDRHGSSCGGILTDIVESSLVRRGYDVSRNRPYAGGFITEHYGRPADGVHAIQIEVNRGLYLNERTLEKSRGFDRLAGDLAGLVGDLVRACGDLAATPRVAAE